MSDQFDKIIGTALSEGLNEYEPDKALYDKAVTKLKQNDRRFISMRIQRIFKPVAVKSCAAVLSMALLIGLSVTFISPAKALAEQLKSFVYTVVKNDDGNQSIGEGEKGKSILLSQDGKYKVIKVLYVKPKTKGMIAVGTKDGKVPDGFPDRLKGGYVFDSANKGFDNETGYTIDSVFYSKSNTLVSVSYSDHDFPLVSDEKGKTIRPDNAKSLKIGDCTAVYGEYPFAEYHYVDSNEDRTQPPINVKTIHSLSWIDNGIHYKMSDLKGNLTQDELIKAAESIINQQK
jgi:hypothetical protein